MKQILTITVALSLLTACNSEPQTITDASQNQEIQQANESSNIGTEIKAVQFNNVTDMINTLGDYSEDTGQFQLVSEKPAHFILSPFFFTGDDSKARTNEARRMMLYGVWRTFAHTDAESVTVEVLPRHVTDLAKANEADFMQDQKISVTVSRDFALSSLTKHTDITRFDDLISDGKKTSSIKGISWSTQAENLRRDSNKRDILYNDLVNQE